MKTLDETIKNLEDGLKHLNAILISEETWNDALYYLKEYRDDKDELDSTRLAYLDILTDYVALKNYWAEQQENVPLAWDELKAMTGKPVWIEEKDMPNTWIIVWDVTENWLYPTGCDAYRHEEYVKTWQAYRKERG